MNEHYLPENIENIVLVTVDCLRRDHLEFYGYNNRTMPRLAIEARGGLIVEEAHTNSPFTRSSLPSLFTSSYPLEGSLPYSIRGRPVTIYSLLKERGYNTAGFSADLFLPPVLEYGKGFDHYWTPTLGRSGRSIKDRLVSGVLFRIGRSSLRFFLKYQGLLERATTLPILRDIAYSLTNTVSPYPPAEIPTTKAVEWIRRNKSDPFFLWIHYMDVHNPYLVGGDLRRTGRFSHFLMEQYLTNSSQEEYEKRGRISLKDDTRSFISALREVYDERIGRVDASIGKLIDVIREEGIDKETVFILTSDHGQGFLEHGFYSHGAYFYEEILRVPLLIVPLGGVMGWKRLGGYRSHVDVPPTILSLLGERKEVGYRGKDIIGEPSSGVVYAEALHNQEGRPLSASGQEEVRVTFGVKKESRKYIVQYRGSNVLWEELFDLASDPEEEMDLSEDESHRQELNELRSEVLSHIRLIGFDLEGIERRYKSIIENNSQRRL